MNKMRISTKREIILKKNLEVKNTITELTNSIGGFSGRLNQAEGRISKWPEDDHLKLLSQRSRKDKEWKSETVWGFWDTIRQINVIIIGTPEGEAVGYAESLLEEIIAKKKIFFF